jgi:hypothetical protein
MRIRVLVGTALATAALAAAPLTAAAAHTTDVLTTGHTFGPNVAVGATIKAYLKAGTQATFYSPGSTTGVVCTSASTTSKVTANPAAPGTANESLTGQSFKNCTTNITGVTLQSIAITGLPYAVTVGDGAGKPVAVANAATTVTFGTPIGPLACSYTDASVAGVASNSGSKIKFTNQTFTLTPSSSADCPPSADFSATFGPQKDISASGHPRVFVN